MVEGMGELLGVGAAARLAGVGPDTIRRWCDAGILPHVRTPGGQRRVEADAIRAMHTARRARPSRSQFGSLSELVEAIDVALGELLPWTPEPDELLDDLVDLRLRLGGSGGDSGLLDELARVWVTIGREIDGREDVGSLVRLTDHLNRKKPEG